MVGRTSHPGLQRVIGDRTPSLVLCKVLSMNEQPLERPIVGRDVVSGVHLRTAQPQFDDWQITDEVFTFQTV